MDIDFEGVSGDRAGTRGGPATAEVLPARTLEALGLTARSEAEAIELRPPTRGAGGGYHGTVQFASERTAAPGEAEFLLVRSGSDGIRVVQLDPEASTGDTSVYRVPASPGPSVDRGFVSSAARWVVQKVVFPVIDDVIGEITNTFVRRWEDKARPHRVRRWSEADYRSPVPKTALAATEARGPVLLVVHGTNSLSHSASGTGAIGGALLTELLRRYGGNVFAFDHPTLATDPTDNARWLLEQFLEPMASRVRVDILCHSRGGLVSRALAEVLEFEPIRSISMVATPNQGTPLADGEHLGRFVDRLLSLETLVPDNPVTAAIEGAITIAKQVAVAGWGGLDGMSAMSPSGSWIREHLAKPRSDIAYRALAADFEPAPGSGLWSALKDGGIDVVFGGEMNDSIVPTIGALDIGGGPGKGFDDIVVLDEHENVRHSGFFEATSVQPVLHSWLDPSAPARSVPLAGRYDEAGARALASIGPEWSVEGVVDLTCFAPTALHGPLADTVRELGSLLYPSVGARGDAAAPPQVVVVPGIMGSELSMGGERIWMSPWRLAQGGLDALRLTGADTTVEAVEPLCFAYRQLLEALTEDHDVIAFPYDWRRSVVEAGDGLRTLLTELLEASDGDGRPIHLVGHSLGGLVIRHALSSADRDLQAELVDRGGRIVQLGTPNRGSFAAPLALRGEYPPIRFLAALDIRKDIDEVLEIVWTFSGLLELLPDPRLDSGEESAAFLYDPKLWGKRLASAEALRASLDAAGRRHEALSLDGSGIDLIVGDGMPTPSAARRSPTLGFEIEVCSAGDGTVAHVCSDLENVQTWFATGVSHGNLVKDARTVRALRDILVRGSTDLLRVTPSQLGRGGTTPEAGRWYSPVEAAVMVDPSDSTDRMSVGEPPWTRRDAAVRMVDGMVAVAGQAPPSRGQLEVSVRHGDLQCADYPLLIGHASGTPIAGAEGRCDALLGGALTKMKNLGLFPDADSTYRYIPSASPEDRLAGCLVIGLDPCEVLTRSTLTDLVQPAVIDFANQYSSSGATAGMAPSLSVVPLGTGPVFEMRVEDSVAAVCDAVLAANDVLRANDQPTIARLQIIDCYAGKIEKSCETLRTLARLDGRRAGGGLTLVEEILEAPGARPGMPSVDYDDGRWEQLSIEVEKVDDVGTEAAPRRQAHLRFRRARGRAVVDDSSRVVDDHLATELVRMAVDEPAKTVAAGADLFENLLPLALKQEWSSIGNMILQVDDKTADLPWEMLVDRRAGGLPFICESGLVRQFRLPPSRVHAVASIAAGALVIGDPPSALPTLPGAGSEAEAVGQVLTSAGTATTTIIGSTAGGERGSLDIDIARALNSSDHRVLHIAAHGLYRRTDGTTVGGVVIGENAFITADLLANLTIVPEIVFLNCCHLGQIGPGAEGAFDPIEHRHQASSLARVLMVAGVRALVVAGWAVDDGRAAAFAVQFWSALAAGQMFGDAVSDARRTIFEQSRDNTWAAYQCYGDPGWRLRQVTDSSDENARPVVNLRAWAARRSFELEAKAADLVDAHDLRVELEQLEFHIERHWPDHGDLLAALAAAHADIGDLERAEELYARAIADPLGRAPVRAIEQGFNLLCRLALAARQRGDEAAVQALLERLEASRSLVEGLPDNAERKALDGAHWKRMAALYASTAGTEYLDRAIASYVASADSIRLAGDGARDGRLDLYGFRNALQLAALGDQPDPVRPLLVVMWLDAWEADLAPRPARGDISERIGRADSLLAAALLPPDGALDKAIRSVPGERPLLLSSLLLDLDDDPSGEVRDQLVALYRGALSRGRQERGWRSALENLQTLSELGRLADRQPLAEGLAHLRAALES